MKYASRTSQKGMALLISLVVLVVVSILGATAMRSAAFQSKVSVNAQASQLVFQASESGLAAAARFADQQVTNGIVPTSSDHIYALALNGTPQRICFAADGTTAVFADAIRTVIDNDNIKLTYPTACPAVAGSPTQVTTVVSRPPCGLDNAVGGAGYSVNGGDPYSSRTVYVQSFAQLAGVGLTSSHVQLWEIRGKGAGCS